MAPVTNLVNTSVNNLVNNPVANLHEAMLQSLEGGQFHVRERLTPEQGLPYLAYLSYADYVAIGMTLTAVVLASLLPLHAQAQAPEPAPVDAAARTHGDDAKRNAAHERHW